MCPGGPDPPPPPLLEKIVFSPNTNCPKKVVGTLSPFGLRSAPYLFNQFAEALQWILQNNYGFECLIHYLDDYLIITPANFLECHHLLTIFLRVCKLLGIPVAFDKVEGPATLIVSQTTASGQTGGYSEGAGGMAAAGQSNQASTAFTNREAVICCKSSACWSLVYQTLDQTEHQGEEATSPHSPQSGSQGGHPLVEVVPPILEWNSLVCGHHINSCHRPGDLHRCIWVTWLWSLLQRSMVPL